MQTQALDSSLWELLSHSSHYHAPVSTMCNIFSEAFTKPGYAMEDFLDHTYNTVCSFSEHVPSNAHAFFNSCSRLRLIGRLNASRHWRWVRRVRCSLMERFRKLLLGKRKVRLLVLHSGISLENRGRFSYRYGTSALSNTLIMDHYRRVRLLGTSHALSLAVLALAVEDIVITSARPCAFIYVSPT